MMDATHNPDRLADDILRGAEAIADYVYGDPEERRKIYHLASTSKLPTFKLGSMVCARKSKLLAWIVEQEQRSGRPSGRRSELPLTK